MSKREGRRRWQWNGRHGSRRSTCDPRDNCPTFPPKHVSLPSGDKPCMQISLQTSNDHTHLEEPTGAFAVPLLQTSKGLPTVPASMAAQSVWILRKPRNAMIWGQAICSQLRLPQGWATFLGVVPLPRAFELNCVWPTVCVSRCVKAVSCAPGRAQTSSGGDTCLGGLWGSREGKRGSGANNRPHPSSPPVPSGISEQTCVEGICPTFNR